VEWVYEMPVWTASLLIIGGCCALAAAGLYLVRTRYPRYAEITHNDVAGPVMATIGTVLAVMLSFMVVVVWQEYDAAGQIVNTEASEIADLYHTVGPLPAATRTSVRDGLERYVHLVVHDEWPLMKEGRASDAARRTAIAVVEAVQRYQPRTFGQQNLASEAITHAHNLLDARRNRLFQNQQAVPGLVWTMLFFVAGITLASTYFFRVASARAHVAMALALAAVVGATFVMIAELDLPFRGPMQIDAGAFSMDAIVFNEEPNR